MAATATVASLAVEITGDISGLNRALTTAERGVKGFGGKLKKSFKDIGGGLTEFGTSLGLLTAPLIGLGALAIGASIEFESAFANVEKTVSGSEEELATLRDTLRSMATGDTPLASLDNALITLTNIAAMGGSLGVPTQDLGKFVETVALLDAASDDLDAETAAKFIGQFANVTKLPVDQWDNLADAIVKLGNGMATTEGQITQFANRLSPLANYKWEPKDIIAYSAALASLGVSPELGGTNLLKTVQDLTEAVALGGPKLDAFAEAAGLTANEFKAMAEADPEGAFNKFIEGLSKMDADDQLATLRELGITSAEQITTIQRLAGGYDKLTEALGLSSDAWTKGGDALTEAQKKAGTTQGKINELKNGVNDLLVSIGDQLTGKLGDLATKFTPIVKNIKDWVDKNPELVAAIAGATVVLGGLAIGAAAAGLVFSGVGVVVGGLTTGFGLLAAAVGLVSLPVALLVGAIGLLAFTIATLGPGIVESWRKAFEEIGKFVQNVIGKVQELINKIGEALRALPGLQPSIGEHAQSTVDRMKAAGYFDGGADGTHAAGLTSVPFNGYMASLHKGEAVLNRSEADAWRGGSGGGGVTINIFGDVVGTPRQEFIESIVTGLAERGIG
jgi:TP901 family phage tail tape measure protein